MGENNTGNEEEKDLDAENGDADQDESQKGADEEDEAASEDENDEGKPDGDKADEDEEDDKKSDKTKSKPAPKADEEPQTRKRNIDFILDRKNRKIEKLQEKTAGAAKKDEEEEEDEDGLADEDAKIIDKRVNKILSPFIQKQMADEDKQEIADFVAANPDFKPYAEKVAKFAQHASRKNLPIESIFYEVAGKDLLKIGADRGKKADDKTKHTQAGGGGNRGGDAPKNVWDLTPAEFAAEQEKIRNKPRE